MLSPIEKVLFVLAVAASLYFTYRGVRRIIAHIGSGHGRPDWKLAWKRIGDLIVKVGLFQPVFRLRLGPSILHGLIGWGFLAFLLINLSDLIYAFTNFRLLESLGAVGSFYLLLADVAGVAIILGIIGMAIRRFILRPKTLSTRESTHLLPKARFGIRRDSAIVAAFIFTHNMKDKAAGIDLAGQLKSRAFQIAWLSQRVVEKEVETIEPSARLAFAEDIRSEIRSYDRILKTLKEGRGELGMKAVADAEVLAQLEDVRKEWDKNMKPFLLALLALPEEVPESEARQVAQWAFRQGGNRIFLVVGETSLDARVAQAFAEEAVRPEPG